MKSPSRRRSQSNISESGMKGKINGKPDYKLNEGNLKDVFVFHAEMIQVMRDKRLQNPSALAAISAVS